MQRPPAAEIPDSPGSYQFYDVDGRVIYVGKAHSLRQRLSNYFQSPANLAPRTAQMMSAAVRVEWIQVGNDVEALMLEYNLIKEHKPRFNIRLRDDKSYPWLALSLAEQWPRPVVMRGQKRKGTRYFGPYAHAYAIRETLDLLLRSFPLRSCSDAKLARHQKLGRPCLLFHIEKCCGPCTDEVDATHYQGYLDELMAFLEGDTEGVVSRLRREMTEAAQRLEYEHAARLRDRLASVEKAIERQQMVTRQGEDVDVFGFADDGLEASVQIFHVRHGRVVGRRGFIVDEVEEMSTPQLVERIVAQLYGGLGALPPEEILLPYLPDNFEVVSTWLQEQRGSRVKVRVPMRGDKKALAATVELNARQELARHRLRRATDHNARAKALRGIQESLSLPNAPLRIECFDMSHLQGSDYVGSMVVMEDGLPKKSDYRRFKVTTVDGNDDYAAMREVLRRRLRSLVAEDQELQVLSSSENPSAVGKSPDGSHTARRRFAYPPQLLLVDGGKGQLSAGVEVLKELELTERIPIAALAKQFEEIYLPNRSDPIRLSRSSESLYMLQRLRDEAHRFAIAYHRQLRGRRSRASILDGIAGMGPARKARLLKELGGLRGLNNASLEELQALNWLPKAVADAVWKSLHDPSWASAMTRRSENRQSGTGSDLEAEVR